LIQLTYDEHTNYDPLDFIYLWFEIKEH
jgi:hypothetical protein